MTVIGWMLLSASIDWTAGLYNEQLAQCGGAEQHRCEMEFHECRDAASEHNKTAVEDQIFFCVAVYETEEENKDD